jgi:hypothetical protein
MNRSALVSRSFVAPMVLSSYRASGLITASRPLVLAQQPTLVRSYGDKGDKEKAKKEKQAQAKQEKEKKAKEEKQAKQKEESLKDSGKKKK